MTNVWLFNQAMLNVLVNNQCGHSGIIPFTGIGSGNKEDIRPDEAFPNPTVLA